MQIQRLQPRKDIPLAVVLLRKLLGINIGKHDVANHLKLVVSCHKTREINALSPGTAGPNSIKVVHVEHIAGDLP